VGETAIDATFALSSCVTLNGPEKRDDAQRVRQFRMSTADFVKLMAA
jgi:hypothetical protein